MSKQDDLTAALSKISLAKYAQVIKDQGFENVDDLTELTDEETTQMGKDLRMKLGEIMRLRRCLRSMRSGVSTEQPGHILTTSQSETRSLIHETVENPRESKEVIDQPPDPSNAKTAESHDQDNPDEIGPIQRLADETPISTSNKPREEIESPMANLNRQPREKQSSITSSKSQLEDKESSIDSSTRQPGEKQSSIASSKRQLEDKQSMQDRKRRSKGEDHDREQDIFATTQETVGREPVLPEDRIGDEPSFQSSETKIQASAFEESFDHSDDICYDAVDGEVKMNCEERDVKVLKSPPRDREDCEQEDREFKRKKNETVEPSEDVTMSNLIKERTQTYGEMTRRGNEEEMDCNDGDYESETEDFLVVVEFPAGTSLASLSSLKSEDFEGLDSTGPSVQLGGRTLRGGYEPVIGSHLIFSSHEPTTSETNVEQSTRRTPWRLEHIVNRHMLVR